jgi:hypothetical protein
VTASCRGSPKAWAIMSAIQWSNAEPVPDMELGAVAAMANGVAGEEAMGTCRKGFFSLPTCRTWGTGRSTCSQAPMGAQRRRRRC